MKKMIVFIFPIIMLSCMKERVDLPKSIIIGEWVSGKNQFIFEKDTCHITFNNIYISGKWYVAERTVMILFEDGTVLRIKIEHYSEKEIECKINNDKLKLIKI
jgi:hypothetical protein